MEQKTSAKTLDLLAGTVLFLIAVSLMILAVRGAYKWAVSGYADETEQCKRAYKAEKKIKKKLWELMYAGKIHSFGVSYYPPKWGERCVIHVMAEDITKNLTSQVPQWIDGIEVVWEQGTMPKAQ